MYTADVGSPPVQVNVKGLPGTGREVVTSMVKTYGTSASAAQAHIRANAMLANIIAI